VIERDPTLAAFLRQRFPGVQVRCAEAVQAKHILSAESVGGVQTVISSLPLRNFSVVEKMRTVRAMMGTLSKEGQLIQFTYGAGCPIPSRKLGLKAELLGRVWLNVPPAAVWRFTAARYGCCSSERTGLVQP
jgi:phosphatidylethanolamine/phosphatidyl-N-methylethanolamine N-methyltransferase